MKDLNLEYNSTYISINLLDELDYVLGGYGKPNAIFIYSLNAFLEAYILNSKFYISGQEAKHFQIVSKAMFPNGRPALELLTKSKSLMAIGGIGNDIGQVVSLGKFDPDNPTSYQERIEHYINNGLKTEETRSKYLILPSISDEIKDYKYLNIGRVDDGYVATESSNAPDKFYKKLRDATKHSNVQATLPFYSYQFQIADVQSRGIGREIITQLTDGFKNKQKLIDQYFGNTHQTIPPLVTILLSQCKSVSDVPDKMFQLREDFTKLRLSVVNYEKRINKADKIKEQLDAIDELNEFWKVFNKKYSEDKRLLYQFWEVAEDSNYQKSIDDAIDTGDTSEIIEDLNLGKVAGKGAKKIFEWYKERKVINRFRGVTDIWKLFENAPNVKKHLAEFERVFGVSIDETELITLNKRLEQIKLHTTKPKAH
jgi:hypothetical protein